jgi:F-type H+-transporting ATPase subunit delta
MIVTANAKRYAKALFELAKEKNLLDKVHRDFKNFLILVGENADLQFFLNLPLDQERETILSNILKERFCELFFNFLLIVLKNKRFYLFEQIFDDFEKRVDSLNNRISAVAITAFPLPKDKLADMTREIADFLKAEVRLENEVDQSIIGGIILRLDDKIFNASLSEQFKKLKYHLIQNQK